MFDNAPEKKLHWNKVYSSKGVEHLGWYEDIPAPSFKLIQGLNLNIEDRIIDVGCGASTLIDNLIDLGYKNIFAVDLSESAINQLKNRLGDKRASKVRWIVDDLTSPSEISKLKDIALWHDRAVLHFLVNEHDRQTYRKILTDILKENGYVIIAAFSLEGANKCSGLDVYKYDEKTLANFLGKEFTLMDYFHYLYKMPSGEERPYIYTLFKRNK